MSPDNRWATSNEKESDDESSHSKDRGILGHGASGRQEYFEPRTTWKELQGGSWQKNVRQKNERMGSTRRVKLQEKITHPSSRCQDTLR